MPFSSLIDPVDLARADAALETAWSKLRPTDYFRRGCREGAGAVGLHRGGPSRRRCATARIPIAYRLVHNEHRWWCSGTLIGDIDRSTPAASHKG